MVVGEDAPPPVELGERFRVGMMTLSRGGLCTVVAVLGITWNSQDLIPEIPVCPD